MNSAKKLLQFDFDADAFARRAPRPTAILSERLAILEKIAKDHDGKGSGPLDQESLHQIYPRFINAIQSGDLQTEFDTPKHIRQLAWALTDSEGRLPRIVDTPQLRNALQLIENHFRISALLGVFNALLQAWDRPNAGMLRTFVKKRLTDYDGSRRFVQKLKANMAWYCEENSPTKLVMSLLRSQVKLPDVWSYLELPDHTHSYPYFGAVAEAYVSISNPRDTGAVADIVNFIIKHNNDKRAVPFCRNSLKDLDLMRLEVCGNLFNPTPSKNGGIRESLAGRCAGVVSPMRQNRFLRDGLRKRIFAFSSM